MAIPINTRSSPTAGQRKAAQEERAIIRDEWINYQTMLTGIKQTERMEFSNVKSRLALSGIRPGSMMWEMELQNVRDENQAIYDEAASGATFELLTDLVQSEKIFQANIAIDREIFTGGDGGELLSLPGYEGNLSIGDSGDEAENLFVSQFGAARDLTTFEEMDTLDFLTLSYGTIGDQSPDLVVKGLGEAPTPSTANYINITRRPGPGSASSGTGSTGVATTSPWGGQPQRRNLQGRVAQGGSPWIR